MTRAELLQLVIGQARSEGFNLRRWYVGRLGRPWVGMECALRDLAEERRYYALLFSHEFASSFWKPGSLMTMQVPQQSFPRRRPDGSIRTIVRKGYTRRRTRADAWQFHLREMAVQEEPLRYVRRFLRVEEDLAVEEDTKSPSIVIVDEEDLLPEDED